MNVPAPAFARIIFLPFENQNIHREKNQNIANKKKVPVEKPRKIKIEQTKFPVILFFPEEVPVENQGYP